MKQVRVVIPGWDANPDQGNCLSPKSPVLQKFKPRLGTDSPRDLDDVTPEGAGHHGDEDAFTPSQMEEFRQLACSPSDNHTVVTKTVLATQPEPARLPNSICIQVPSRLGEAGGGSPHLFPALKERPLTQSSTPRAGGDPELYIGAAASSADNNRHSLTKLPRKAKEGEDLMVKPLPGRPGIVSLHGHVFRDLQWPQYSKHNDHEDQFNNGFRPYPQDTTDQRALVTNVTSGCLVAATSTALVSDVKINSQSTTQMAFIGQETRRIPVGEVTTRSRNSRARSGVAPGSACQQNDWHSPGENGGRLSAVNGAAGCISGRALQQGPRAEKGNRVIQDVRGDRENPPELKKRDDTIRAKTAPPARRHCRLSFGWTSQTVPEGHPAPVTTQEGGPPPSVNGPFEGREEILTRRISVVQLELPDTSKARSQNSSSSALTPRSLTPAAPRNTAHASTSSRFVYPTSTYNCQHTKHQSLSRGLKKLRCEAVDVVEQNCFPRIKHADSTRESATMVHRWNGQDCERKDKWKRWRIRISFSAPSKGKMGKILSRV